MLMVVFRVGGICNWLSRAAFAFLSLVTPPAVPESGMFKVEVSVPVSVLVVSYSDLHEPPTKMNAPEGHFFMF